MVAAIAEVISGILHKMMFSNLLHRCLFPSLLVTSLDAVFSGNFDRVHDTILINLSIYNIIENATNLLHQSIFQKVLTDNI